jgi:hypothetical protein
MLAQNERESRRSGGRSGDGDPATGYISPMTRFSAATQAAWETVTRDSQTASVVRLEPCAKIGLLTPIRNRASGEIMISNPLDGINPSIRTYSVRHTTPHRRTCQHSTAA